MLGHTSAAMTLDVYADLFRLRPGHGCRECGQNVATAGQFALIFDTENASTSAGLAFAPRLSPVSLPMSMAMSLLPIPSPPKGPVPPARPKSPVPPVASAMLPLPMAIAMSPVPEVAV
jgi:hypothetical protein